MGFGTDMKVTAPFLSFLKKFFPGNVLQFIYLTTCQNQDQLGDINQYTLNGIQLLQDFRDFLKERVVIEQQYAQSMDKLAKSYIKKFAKNRQTFYGAGTPFQMSTPDIEGLGYAPCQFPFFLLYSNPFYLVI